MINYTKNILINIVVELGFFIKLIPRLHQLHQQSKPSLFITSNLMKKHWSDLRNLTKYDQIASFSQKSRLNWNWKILED